MSTTALSIAEASGYEPAKLQLIKDLVANDTTDDELALFLYTAKRTGLDPLARQIYCIKRWNSALNKSVATLQTSIDGYRLIADRTGAYAPGRVATYTYDADHQIVSATAYVMKYVQGHWHEVAAEAFWDEYVAIDRNGSITRMWKEKPHIMLSKCAEALALRRAFPAELSGLYTSDEMGKAHANYIDAPAYEVEEPAPPPAPSQAPHLPMEVKPLRQRMIESLQVLAAEYAEYDAMYVAPDWHQESDDDLAFRGRELKKWLASSRTTARPTPTAAAVELAADPTE